MTHGWQTLDSGVMHQTLTLPTTFAVQPDHYPLGMYWAYHNVLSKAVGLDLSPYLGQQVTVYMIPLQQWNPHISAPALSNRGPAGRMSNLRM